MLKDAADAQCNVPVAYAAVREPLIISANTVEKNPTHKAERTFEPTHGVGGPSQAVFLFNLALTNKGPFDVTYGTFGGSLIQ